MTGNMKAWIESRYIANWNFIAFFFFSFGFYYIYLWGGHFIEWVAISYTVVQLHSTPLTYLIVICSSALMHSIDRAILLWRQVFKPKPADFLQKVAAQRKASIGMRCTLGREKEKI